MPSPLMTKFENALIDLIEIYVRDGMSSNDINGVLLARSGDDHFEHILEQERERAAITSQNREPR